MKKPVLLVIDMVRDFFERSEPSRKERLVQAINELVAVMRRLSHPVIWVRQEFEPDLREAFPEMRAKGIRITIKRTEGCESLPQLSLATVYLLMRKKRNH